MEENLNYRNCNNIIEQVTDFKYLGYRISEYKSDLENKLQTFNKINGAIRRHFGKQMNKETKLTLGLLMSYIYGAPILDVSRSHKTTHHSR